MEENYYAYNIIKKLYYPDDEIEDESKEEEEILAKYISKENLGGSIELPDILTNINGNHIYPVVSSKDIDWNNAFLPSSALSESNWGSFDILRRWGNDTQISINNVYELINVVDYLLCTCEDLWSEINKLKYGDANDNEIWFLIDSTRANIIMSFNEIQGEDFTKERIRSTENKISEVSYLTPDGYYNTVAGNKLGIGTFFFVENPAEYNLYKIRRLVPGVGGRKGVKGYISEEQSAETAVTAKQNFNGIVKDIYAYKIGSDLHLFPGFYIDNFISRTQYTTDYISLIDFKNKKFKNDECYFKVDDGLFKKVYCEFLYSDVFLYDQQKHINEFNYEQTTETNNKQYIPFILYYIDDNTGKKIVIYISFTKLEDGGTPISITGKYCGNFIVSRENIISRLQESINGNNSMYSTDEAEHLENYYDSVQGSIVKVQNSNLYIPLLYLISDEYTLNFTVITPQTTTNAIANFKETQKTITVHYYKSDNDMKVKLYTTGEDSGVIEKSEDYDSVFTNCISYSPQRYNIPDDTEVNIEVDAPWIYDANNPDKLKIDDEYIDYPLYHYSNYSNQYNQFYQYNSVDTTTGKRVFNQFQSRESFEDYCSRSTVTDSTGTPFVHIYQKVKNPYQISYNVSVNSQVLQEISQGTVNNIVNELNTNSSYLYNSNSYNNIRIKYPLPPGVEQVKVDLTLNIDETAKVKGSSYILPININKMHHPMIYFMSKKVIQEEINKYSQEEYKNYYKFTFNTVTEEYDKENVTLGSIYSEITHYGNNYNNIIDIVDEIYGNTISQGNIDQHFYDNTLEGGYDIEISYNTTLPYINLIGTDFLYKENVNSPYNSITINGHTINGRNAYLINVTGLEENYRLHGANSYFSRFYGTNASSDIDVNSYYDILNNGALNKNYNLSYFLGIKLEDRGDETDIQLKGLSYKNGEYFDNQYDFIYNIKPDNNGISKLISDPITIVFKNYENKIQSFKEMKYNNKNILSNNQMPQISYYVHMSYMVTNSSTFYPPVNTRPTLNESTREIEYNLNDDDDLVKINEYINSWDDSNVGNYHPITMSLKYMKNNYRNTPYFFESNEFKMRFNILRSNTNQYSGAIGGTTIPIAVALGERYYLSDFIEAFITLSDNKVLNRNSVGSYMYYNTKTHNYNFKEIYSNTVSDSIIKYENSDVQLFVEGGTTGTNSNPNNPASSIKVNINLPILKDEEGNYIYDIERMSAINKLKFNNSFNETLYGVNLHIDDLQYIDITDGFVDNYTNGSGNYIFNSNNIELKNLIKTITVTHIYGNKNYNNVNVTNQAPAISIIPIYRRKVYNNGVDECGINYPTKNLTIGDYTETIEFFKYFDDDIYDNQTKSSLTEKTFKENFNDQVNAFRNYKICDGATLEALLGDGEEEIPMSSRASEIYIDEEG